MLRAFPRQTFAAAPSPSSPARLPAVPDGQNAMTFCPLPRQTKTRRATLKRFCPAGANSVAPAHRQRPLPLRGKAASLNARLRRRQAPAREPAAVCSDCRPIRNEAQRARPLLVGRTRVAMGPKALAAGTAGWADGSPGARRPLLLRSKEPPRSVENAGLPLVLSSLCCFACFFCARTYI